MLCKKIIFCIVSITGSIFSMEKVSLTHPEVQKALRFFNAIQDRNLSLVRDYLAQDCASLKGEGLKYAAQLGYDDVAQMLLHTDLDGKEAPLEFGFQHGIRRIDQWNAYRIAMATGQMNVVALFKSTGVPSVLDLEFAREHDVPIDLFVRENIDLSVREGVVQWALETGNLAVMKKIGDPALFMHNCGDYLKYAAKKGDLAVVRYLLELGIKGGQEDALWVAVEYGHAPIVRLLLEGRNDDDQSSHYVRKMGVLTASHIKKIHAIGAALEKGYSAVIELLLEAGVIERVQKSHLLAAIRSGSLPLVKLLFKKEVGSSARMKAIGFAATQRQWPIVEFLVHENDLLKASYDNNVELLETLVRKPLDKFGLEVALELIVCKSNKEALELLLAHKLISSTAMMKALILAASFSGLEITHMLCEAVLAQKSATDLAQENETVRFELDESPSEISSTSIVVESDGEDDSEYRTGSFEDCLQQALVNAIRFNQLKTLRLLLRYADEALKKTICLRAAGFGDEEAIMLLLKEKVIEPNDRALACEYAAANNQIAVIKMLLSAGLSNDALNKAIICAAENGNMQALQVLLEHPFDHLNPELKLSRDVLISKLTAFKEECEYDDEGGFNVFVEEDYPGVAHYIRTLSGNKLDRYDFIASRLRGLPKRGELTASELCMDYCRDSHAFIQGGNLLKRDEDGRSCLMWAVLFNDRDVFDRFMKIPLPTYFINALDNNCKTAADYAACFGRLEYVLKLVKKGYEGRSLNELAIPLCRAAKLAADNGHMQVAAYLILNVLRKKIEVF